MNLTVKDTGVPGPAGFEPASRRRSPRTVPAFGPWDGRAAAPRSVVVELRIPEARGLAQTRRTGGEGLNVDAVIDAPGGGRVPSRGVAFLLLERRAWWSNGECR